ncbi:MAG: hypothetical protein V4850_34495 [Myxococcota bacterium]
MSRLPVPVVALLFAFSLALPAAYAGTLESADPVAYMTELRKVGDNPTARIEIHCRYVLAMAAKAKADMSENLFVGIKEKLTTAATEGVELGKARGTNDPEYLRMKQLLTDTVTDVQATIDYIKAHKLDVVEMPKDLYAGADKSKLKAAVAEAWKTRYAADEVLAIRFPQAAWDRKVTEEWVGDTKKRYDISSMVVHVVVKKTTDVATIHGLYLQVNHHTSEALQVGTKDGGFSARDMWMKNVKP